MKCQILFSRNNKKNSINLSSAEILPRVLNIAVFLLSVCVIN